MSSQFSVSAHFDGKEPATRKIYDRLVKASSKFGPVAEDPKKTSIHLVNKTAFCGCRHPKERNNSDHQERSEDCESSHSQVRTDVCQPVSS